MTSLTCGIPLIKNGWQRIANYRKKRKQLRDQKARRAEKTTNPPARFPGATTTKPSTPSPSALPQPSPPVLQSEPPTSEEQEGPSSAPATGPSPLDPPTKLEPRITPITDASEPSSKGGISTTTSQAKSTSKPLRAENNIDRMFAEAWKPTKELTLANGAPIPWSRGRASPSEAADYLDDIENGRV